MTGFIRAVPDRDLREIDMLLGLSDSTFEVALRSRPPGLHSEFDDHLYANLHALVGSVGTISSKAGWTTHIWDSPVGLHSASDEVANFGSSIITAITEAVDTFPDDDVRFYSPNIQQNGRFLTLFSIGVPCPLYVAEIDNTLPAVVNAYADSILRPFFRGSQYDPAVFD